MYKYQSATRGLLLIRMKILSINKKKNEVFNLYVFSLCGLYKNERVYASESISLFVSETLTNYV